jgi:S1-C subfamily serine protease
MRARTLLTLLALVILLLVAGCGGDGGDRQQRAASPAAASFADIPDIVDEVQPSVVAIKSTLPEGQAEGSGVIWSRDGQIVTNNHVVEGATSVKVILADGHELKARVRATDPRTDLAVVEVDRHDLPPARFATGLPRVGELAVALGSPLGFENTATAGIVSGLDRAIPNGGRTPALVGLLQTDAAISPGNSGGALIDGKRQVIGINVAYIPPQASAVSIGFAIPAPVVRRVVGELLKNGHVDHPFLGVRLAPLSPQIAQRLGVETDQGVIVAAVEQGSPADRAAIEAGDVLTTLDGRKLHQIEDVLSALRGHRPGQTVPAIVLHDGKPRTVQITLGDRRS